MSAGFSPLQREVIARLGFTLMERRTVAMRVPHQGPDVEMSSASLPSDALHTTDTPRPAVALPVWAQRATRFIAAEHLTSELLASLPPRPAEAKRALWRTLRGTHRG